MAKLIEKLRGDKNAGADALDIPKNIALTAYLGKSHNEAYIIVITAMCRHTDKVDVTCSIGGADTVSGCSKSFGLQFTKDSTDLRYPAVVLHRYVPLS